MSRTCAGRVILIGELMLASVGFGAVPAAQTMARRVSPDFDHSRPVGFEAQVIPTLSKLGCSSGSCHGKASGQNGFHLSLFGFDPVADHAAIRERIDSTDPESSLVLLKPSAQVPHGGGLRLPIDSVEYETLVRWIAGPGSEAKPVAEPKLVRLEAVPGRQVLPKRGIGSVRIEAAWDDGSVVDVSRLCQFESPTPTIVSVGLRGELNAGAVVGESAILVRFGREIAVARVVVPSGRPPVTGEPAPTSLVDRLVIRRLADLGLAPSPPATDAEFARRSSLDLNGRLPDPDAVLGFERDTGLDKRVRWVNRLLDRPEYANLFAAKWSAILRNRRALGEISKPGTFGFHAWVRAAIAENWPYNRIVRAIVAAKGELASNPNVAWYRHVATTTERTDDVAQVFLGIRIGCARCHHHPTERWGMDDHAALAAFFDRVGTKSGLDPNSFRVFNLAAYSPGNAVPPRPPESSPITHPGPRDDPREALVEWMQAPENPTFARVVVNRYWKHFQGRGLVEPEDDFRATNPPSNPALLDALADDFRASGFDLKHLVRTITTSDTYARSSSPTVENADDSGNFARQTARRLDAEVLLDAIDEVTDSTSRFAGVPEGTKAVALPDDGFVSPFLDAFGRPERRTACECERSTEPNLSQALFLLNSGEIEAKLADPAGRAARFARGDDSPLDADRVNQVYRIALSRPAAPTELAHALRFLDGRRREGRIAAGWQDLIWAVLNTKEFLSNH